MEPTTLGSEESLLLSALETKEQHLADANAGHVIVTEAVNALLTTLMPNKILQRAKRYLRREARKPLDMKVKTYLLHVNHINHEEIPELPPNYNTAPSLSPDEIFYILFTEHPKAGSAKWIDKDLTPWPRLHKKLCSSWKTSKCQGL